MKRDEDKRKLKFKGETNSHHLKVTLSSIKYMQIIITTQKQNNRKIITSQMTNKSICIIFKKYIFFT